MNLASHLDKIYYMHEMNIAERIQKLEQVLLTIKGETVPRADHNDPAAITDCWNEVDDLLKSVRSGAKRLCFETWNAANLLNRGISPTRYDMLSKELGVFDLHYLPEDNRKITENVNQYLKDVYGV